MPWEHQYVVRCDRCEARHHGTASLTESRDIVQRAGWVYRFHQIAKGLWLCPACAQGATKAEGGGE
jgi:hypothetical protein